MRERLEELARGWRSAAGITPVTMQQAISAQVLGHCASELEKILKEEP